MSKQITHASWRYPLSVASTIAAPVLMAGAVVKYGPIQVNGMDGGVLASAAWQLHLGYKPYAELLTATPPFFLEGARLAFALFGARWMSLVWITAIFVIATYGVHLWLLRRAGLPHAWAVAVAALTQLCSSVPWGMWWYNCNSEALACLFLTAVAAWSPRSRFGAIRTIFFGALLLLGKANVGPPLMAMAFLFLVMRHGWIKVAGAYLCMVLAAVSLLEILHVPLIAMLHNYRVGGSGRVFRPENIADFMLLNGYWEVQETIRLLLPASIGICLLVASVFRVSSDGEGKNLQLSARFDRDLVEGVLLLLISAVSCLISTATNNTFNFVELPILFCGAAFFLRSLYPFTTAGFWRTVASAAIVVSAVGLGANALRFSIERLAVIGAGPFYEDVPPRPVHSVAFFDGVQGGPSILNTVHDLDVVFQDPETRSERVFIGPRIDFAYAAYGIVPCRGLPLWWEAYSDTLKPTTWEAIARFERENFELAVFLKDDYTFMPSVLIDYLKQNYTKSETATLTIYRAK